MFRSHDIRRPATFILGLSTLAGVPATAQESGEEQETFINATDDPHTFFVGFATGGLWKTTNNGTTFKPVFDTYGTHSIGAIAIALPLHPALSH